jgi:hypothetical protein
MNRKTANVNLPNQEMTHKLQTQGLIKRKRRYNYLIEYKIEKYYKIVTLLATFYFPNSWKFSRTYGITMDD